MMPLDSVYVNSNISQQIFPGASFSQNGYFSPATATICCMAVLPGANPFKYNLVLHVNDNGCPMLWEQPHH